MTDLSARAVTAALELCSALAAARPLAPIRIATTLGTFAAPQNPVGAARVTLHVDTLGVIVLAEIKGATRPLCQYSIPFPYVDGAPDVERIESPAFGSFVGANLQAALLVAREQTGAAA
jgi:hypothetical protein